MTEKPASERVTELEIQLAHLQRMFDQLNEVVVEQSSLIDKMRRSVSKLEQQIEGLKNKSPEAPTDPLDEKPPHY